MADTEPNVDDGPVRRFRDPDYRPLAANLGEIRAHIDRLDAQIVTLLAERGRYVKDATRFKRDRHQVAAPSRQQAVIDRVRMLAQASGLPAAVAEAAYRALIAAFVAEEQTYFDQTEPTGGEPR